MVYRLLARLISEIICLPTLFYVRRIIVVHIRSSDTERNVQIGRSPYVYKWVGGWVLKFNFFFSNINVSL